MSIDQHFTLPESTTFGSVLDSALRYLDRRGSSDMDVSIHAVGGGARHLLKMYFGVERTQIEESMQISPALEAEIADAEADDQVLSVGLIVHGVDRRYCQSIHVADDVAYNRALWEVACGIAQELSESLGGFAEAT